MGVARNLVILVWILGLTFAISWADKATATAEASADDAGRKAELAGDATQPLLLAPNSTHTKSEAHKPKGRVAGNNTSTPGDGHKDHRFHVVAWDFAHVAAPYIVSVWLVFASLAKIGE